MIYLDHAAATPVSSKVLDAMRPYFEAEFFNPSSPYLPAKKVASDYEAAKATIAHAIGAKATDIVITAGATEANNLAFSAVAEDLFHSRPRPSGPSPRADGAISRAAALRNAANQNANSHYIILCPHYEGYDERILSIVDYKVSLGKFVLTGGELPALVIIDSIVRLIPGVLGGEKSAEIESFSDGDNLEYPQYTKPAEFRGMKVPEILLSGNHGEIEKWRNEHSGTAK